MNKRDKERLVALLGESKALPDTTQPGVSAADIQKVKDWNQKVLRFLNGILSNKEARPNN